MPVLDGGPRKNGTIRTAWSSHRGEDAKRTDGSKARWCIVQGEIDKEYAGVVMMSFPTNYNFPEPFRIWPENQYNRGHVCKFLPDKGHGLGTDSR